MVTGTTAATVYCAFNKAFIARFTALNITVTVICSHQIYSVPSQRENARELRQAAPKWVT
jgi:hypothetical protein